LAPPPERRIHPVATRAICHTAGKFYIGLSENVQILAMQPIQRGRLPEKPTDRQAHAAEFLQEVGQKTVS